MPLQSKVEKNEALKTLPVTGIKVPLEMGEGEEATRKQVVVPTFELGVKSWAPAGHPGALEIATTVI